MGKFLLVDAAAVFLALFAAFFLKFEELRAENITIYLVLSAPILLTRLASLWAFRLYDFSRGPTAADIVYFTGCAMMIAHGVEALMIYYTEIYHGPTPPAVIRRFDGAVPVPFPKDEPYASPSDSLPSGETPGGADAFQISRHIQVLNFFLAWTAAAGWRILYLRRRRRWAYDRTNLLIVGAGPMADSVLRDIRQYSNLGHDVAGMIDDDIEESRESERILGKMKDLDTIVEERGIDEILITSQMANRRELLEIISACQATGCRVLLLPELYEVAVGKVRIGQVAGIPFIELNSEPQGEWDRFVKRTFDVAVSLAALVVFAPAFAAIAFAIRRSDGGRALYLQERVGRGGRRFVLYKFRTMREDAELESGPVLSWDEDPRVTPVGRVLRRWHLDELPQFYNVLRGDMSLVGPRPERPHFAKRYAEMIPAYRLRERIRPGITGLGQIHGFYNSPVEHKLRYDLAYINNMSLLLDLKILFLTLRVTLANHGKNGNGASARTS